MRGRRHRRIVSRVVGTALLGGVLVSGCGGTQVAAPKGVPGTLPRLTSFTVRVVPPHAASLSDLVPPGHFFGTVRDAFLSCGAVGRSLTPAQMARHPVTVRLLHDGSVVGQVRLDRRSGVEFLIVGPTRVSSNSVGLDDWDPWTPSFTLVATDGYRQAVSFGGLSGVVGEGFDFPPQPNLHPCTASPRTPRR